MFDIALSGDKQLMARLDQMPPTVGDALWKTINELRIRLLLRVQGKLRGQVLNYITGRLFRSIQSDALRLATAMTARVYSSGDVKYAGIHEYGGRTPPHIIMASAKLALHFQWHGKGAFFKLVHHPGSVMPERSYLRSSLDEMREAIIEGMRESVRLSVAART